MVGDYACRLYGLTFQTACSVLHLCNNDDLLAANVDFSPSELAKCY